jgi:hypothetical protein
MRWLPTVCLLALGAARGPSPACASILTAQQLESFRARGVLVVPGILSDAELAEARAGLRATLRRAGLAGDDGWNSTSGRAALRRLQLTGGKGGIVDIYYDAWAMKVRTHPRLFQAMSELWAATWASGAPGFEAPPHFQPFNASEGFAYLDRAAFRVPVPGAGARDSLQPGLVRRGSPATACLHQRNPGKHSPCAVCASDAAVRGAAQLPHFDACPVDLFGERGVGEPASRWRPIQSSVSLTDVAATEHSGGFVAVPGFHRRFGRYFEKWAGVPPNSPGGVHCGGQFSVLRGDGVRYPGTGEDAALVRRLTPLAQPAGSATFWDWRIPHSSTVGMLPPSPPADDTGKGDEGLAWLTGARAAVFAGARSVFVLFLFCLGGRWQHYTCCTVAAGEVGTDHTGLCSWAGDINMMR